MDNSSLCSARGMALPTALVFLLVISMLAVSAVRVGANGVRAAVSEELRVASFVTTQSALDAAIAVPANTPVTSDTGRVYCTPNRECDEAIVALPGGVFAEQVDSGSVQVAIQRLAPAFAPPPRGAGASLNRFYAASFAVQAMHDETGTGFGRTQISEGLILILPRS